MWNPALQVTPKTPVKINKVDYSKFHQPCQICGRNGLEVGVCIKCHKMECQHFFHVECARRANYCLEIEKKGGIANVNSKEKVFKVYCQSHRPFKIISEIE